MARSSVEALDAMALERFSSSRSVSVTPSRKLLSAGPARRARPEWRCGALEVIADADDVPRQLGHAYLAMSLSRSARLRMFSISACAGATVLEFCAIPASTTSVQPGAPPPRSCARPRRRRSRGEDG